MSDAIRTTRRRRLPSAFIGLLLGVWTLAGAVQPLHAHPVPKGNHDRTLTVRLTVDAVIVEYHLEVDPWTLVIQDQPTFEKQVDLANLSQPKQFFDAFTRVYAPLLASGLSASLDNEPLTFTCESYRNEAPAEVRCDFTMRAPWKPSAGTAHRFTFRDGTFLDENGKRKPGLATIALASGPGVRLGPTDPPNTDNQSVRTVFELIDPGVQPASAPDKASAPTAARPKREDSGLLRLFFDSERSRWALLCLAVIFGAGHALTPGHGKTLVAAYLVGERGTVRHAILLGLVTTLTHTSSVLILAVVLQMMFPRGISDDEQGGIQRALELGGGCLIAGLGFWLLLRRLSGKADHIHLGGAGHHHDHDHGHHHHHDHDHDHGHHHPHPVQGGWWGLVLLGINGGLVPCWDAVILLLVAVSMNMLWWALPLLLAFSAGLASVLVAIGILVVRTKALAGKRWEKSRLFRALPLVSSALVTCLGLWLCYQSVQGG